jgi:hypothetical protein
LATSNSLASAQPIPVRLSDVLSVRLYPDTRPNHLETSPLHKGLVLVYRGRELIEEGVGFGVPVAKYADKTYFPGEAAVSAEDGYTLRKVYTLNLVSVKKLGAAGYIDDRLYSVLRKNFERLYLQKKLKGFFNKVMEVRDALKVTTEFQVVKPRGKVAVTYTCQPRCITVNADFSGLALDGCRELLMLNEQGSGCFQKYTDSTGRLLVGNQIGAWDRVDALSASLQSLSGKFRFGVLGRRGAMLYRGFEQTRKRFSWAGLSYAFRPGGNEFGYTIDLTFE